MTLDALDFPITADASQVAPTVTRFSLEGFDGRERRRLLAMMLVMQACGPISDVDDFLDKVKKVDRYIEGGWFR